MDRHVRVAYVDGLRGLAALAVLALHATSWVRPALPAGSPVSFVLRLGTYGVELFFVLSGFCLSYPYLASPKNLDLVRFATRRLVRILPPYYAAIGILGAALFAGARGIVAPGDVTPNVWDIVAQVFFLDRNAHFLSGTFWTLSIELRWYLLFPLGLWLWVVAPRAFLIAGAAAILLFQYTTAAAADLYALPAFMLGIVAAHVALQRSISKRSITIAVLCLFALAAGLDWALGQPSTYPPLGSLDARAYLQPQRTLWEFVAFGLVLVATASTRAQRVLAWRPLALCGEASYSIYLVHLPVVLAIHALLRGMNPFVEAPLLAAVALGCGFAFWRVVEYPITKTVLKEALLARTYLLVERAFAWLRLPRNIVLVQQAPDIPTVTKIEIIALHL